MCGIFALFNNDSSFSKEFIKEEFEKGKARGPENSVLVDNVKSIFGFHRLAINGLNSISNQPIIINDILLICNGEIYNYKELYSLLNVEPTTQSDCEVIIHLYLKYGIEQTLQMVDGVFAFILLDNRISDLDLSSNCYVARDPFGVRPLFILQSNRSDDKKKDKNIIGLASEMKVLTKFHEKLNLNFDQEEYSIKAFIPGTYSSFQLSNKVLSKWECIHTNVPYFIPHFPKTFMGHEPSNEYMYNIIN